MIGRPVQRGIGADGLADIVAVALRHHGVQQEQIGGGLLDRLKHFLAVMGEANLVPGFLQQKLQR